jgi:hypothetical protein
LVHVEELEVAPSIAAVRGEEIGLIAKWQANAVQNTGKGGGSGTMHPHY